MMALMSATSCFIMSTGLSANSKSAGVTLFTRSSVHCADSNTATNNV